MRSIRIAVVGFALAGLWSAASGLRAAIMKVEYDFSTYPAVPFTLQGGIIRTYLNQSTGTKVDLSYPAIITHEAMTADLQFPPYPYVPWGNPQARLQASFHAAVIGYQIVWGLHGQLVSHHWLAEATGSAWTFADVAPLLDFEGTNHFAAEGNYLRGFAIAETGATFGLSGLKLYIDTSVNVPDGSPRFVWFAAVGALILLRRLAAKRV